jgi:serine/threonine-protein kinase RsbW
MADLLVCALARPEAVNRVHDEVERLWRRHPDVDRRDRLRFESGLVEVVGNVVQHAYAGLPQGRVTVEVEVTDDALSAVVGDDGREPEVDLTDPALPEDELHESGRGLALAAASVDSLDHARAEGHNTWTLRCERVHF